RRLRDLHARPRAHRSGACRRNRGWLARGGGGRKRRRGASGLRGLAAQGARRRLIPRWGDERGGAPADTDPVIHRRSRRLAVAAAGLVFLVLAGSAGAHTTSLKFTALARRWVQRDLITVAVSVRPAGVVCQLAVRYHDGQYQPN